jgi:hypothetical protein
MELDIQIQSYMSFSYVVAVSAIVAVRNKNVDVQFSAHDVFLE